MSARPTYAATHPGFIAGYLEREAAEDHARRAGGTVRYCWAGGLDTFEVYAPAPLPTFAQALELAGAEYAYRRGDYGLMLLSRGADGGMHYRAGATSTEAARQWCEVRARELAADITSGAVFGTLLFWDHARRRWYLG